MTVYRWKFATPLHKLGPSLLALLKGAARRSSITRHTSFPPNCLKSWLTVCAAAAGVHEPHAQRHQSHEGLRRRAYGEVGTAGRSTPVLGQRHGPWGCPRRRWIRSFVRSFPPSRRAATWDWPSAVPLWNRTAVGCGRLPTIDEEQHFTSPYRSGSRSHRPWLPET